mmetsp:Transcript_31595/g.50429  ORF Transcript_31595/g.50429 Transcript_31595/m.50429 type:complete len:98 (+) Transcript_31595:3599-3892(+)
MFSQNLVSISSLFHFPEKIVTKKNCLLFFYLIRLGPGYGNTLYVTFLDKTIFPFHEDDTSSRARCLRNCFKRPWRLLNIAIFDVNIPSRRSAYSSMS